MSRKGYRIVILVSALLISVVLKVPAVENISAEYGVAAGRDIRESTISIGLTPEQVRDLALAITRQESAAQAKVEELSRKLDVTHEAVIGFLKILNEQAVPLEKLPETLAKIAHRHRAMLDRLAVLSPEDPAIKALIKQARTAVAEFNYDDADQLLGEAEAAELAALRMAEQLARQAQEAVDRRRLNAAAARAERGELSLTRLRYLEAAQHFKAASERVSLANFEVRGDYLNRYANALYRYGKEKGDNTVLRQAIDIHKKALTVLPREHVPLQWAMTQNNLGLALLRLGEREAGTERLEQAVEAYRAALQEYTRERVPLQWATTQNNLGNALSTLGTQKENIEHLHQARNAIQSAYILYREAGYSQYNAYFEKRLNTLEQRMEMLQ